MIKFTRELLLGAYGFAVRPFRLSKLKGSSRVPIMRKNKRGDLS